MCRPARKVGNYGERLGIDLIGEDSHVERFVDGLVEADEELGQALTATANRHSIGAVFIGGRSDATDSTEPSDRDLAVVN